LRGCHRRPRAGRSVLGYGCSGIAAARHLVTSIGMAVNATRPQASIHDRTSSHQIQCVHPSHRIRFPDPTASTVLFLCCAE
jgi:hypothetical protein